MNETNQFKLKKRAAVLAVASCLTISPLISEAAGLGKLTVLSGLGQPLRAELDIAASVDEISGMTARLAPQDSFRQAGVDYASVLLDLKFAVEKRRNGQTVVKVTSTRPVNEPFLDFLVELNWPSGRLVREYTFLLDPPEIAARQATAPVAEARVVETVRGGGEAVERPHSVKVKSRPEQQAKSVAGAKAASVQEGRVVQHGETLRKIAAESKYDGVSLEQMLVGYFQKNPDAFIGNNVNRMKAGAILSMPEKSAVEAVSDAEAKKVYVAQSGDWNAYRHKLASATTKAPAKTEAASQSSAGKITAKVEEKAAPAQQTKDQVKVSSTEIPAKASDSGKAGSVAEADAIAREKALKEAQDRLAMLEKNVGELQKLVEMKNQKLAELQQQTVAKKEEIKPVEQAKLIEQPKPVEVPKAPVEVKAAEPQKPVETKVNEAAKPADPPKPVEPKPQPPKVVAPPVSVEEPGFMDALFSDPLPLVGGGGLLALLGGYFFFKRRRNQNASVETTAAPGPSSLGPNSVFRMTGGQSVDTGNTPPQTGDFSQTGPGTIDTDEVDPVAEADVYMAYGRDTQAEEILLEALQKDPQRTAIHAKLLEIYANRRSLKQFETLASELYAQTGGAGVEWDKVAAMGAGLDPNNPLYSGTSASVPVASAFDADATMIVSPDALSKATQIIPAALAPVAEPLSEPPINLAKESDSDVNPGVDADLPPIDARPVAPDENNADVLSLDFDLGGDDQAIEPKVETEPDAVPVIETAFDISDPESSNALDFDLGMDASSPVSADSIIEQDLAQDDSGPNTIDFDLDLPQPVDDQPAESDIADFSPAGTLVMSSEMERAASTYVGIEIEPLPSLAAESTEDNAQSIDFDLDNDLPATQTSVNPVLEDPSSSAAVSALDYEQSSDDDNRDLSTTVVNPGALEDDSFDFDVKLTDSVFLGQPMAPPDFDIGSINLDLTAEPVNSEIPSASQAAVLAEPAAVVPTFNPEQTLVVSPESLELAVEEKGGAPEIEEQGANWEEVNTKLDLAKAYEEMGDLEGARELLQEVVSEGPVDLVEQARSILARIGE